MPGGLSVAPCRVGVPPVLPPRGKRRWWPGKAKDGGSGTLPVLRCACSSGRRMGREKRQSNFARPTQHETGDCAQPDTHVETESLLHTLGGVYGTGQRGGCPCIPNSRLTPTGKTVCATG